MKRKRFGPTVSWRASMAAGPPYVYHLLPGNEASLVRECLDRRWWWRPATIYASGNIVPHHLRIGLNGQRMDWSRFPFHGVSLSMCNRLRNNREACVKSRLALNLRRWVYARKRENNSSNGEAYDWVPTTFVLHAGRDTSELVAFREHDVKRKKDVDDAGTWIVKPEASNRGRGVEVLGSAQDVEQHLACHKTNDVFVAQVYLESPLLVFGRKFDIRVFALVTPDGNCYVYKDSYVRTCVSEYTLEDLGDKAVHLTNDAVQQRLPGYGTHEECNKMSFQQFQRALDDGRRESLEPTEDTSASADTGARIDFENHVWPAIERVTAEAFRATLGRGADGGTRKITQDLSSKSKARNGPTPNPEKKPKAFTYELFGLDFMLDQSGSPVLLEINTSPALFRHGEVLKTMLPLMMEEVVCLTVDAVFPPPNGGEKNDKNNEGISSPKKETRFKRLDVLVDVTLDLFLERPDTSRRSTWRSPSSQAKEKSNPERVVMGMKKTSIGL
tara:strand:- start:383 stop:1882 length:1500 start_codon:yes stop_codon:yes gene_type:complete